MIWYDEQGKLFVCKINWAADADEIAIASDRLAVVVLLMHVVGCPCCQESEVLTEVNFGSLK